MSAPQKLRQRRRLRNVDAVVSILDTALKRQAGTALTSASSPSQRLPQEDHQEEDSAAAAADILYRADGTPFPDPHRPTPQSTLRHGKGPKRGDLLPAGSKHTTLNELARERGTIKLLERWKAEMPTESEMLPRDKYTMFDRKARGYRKGVHKLPKWTRVSQRVNPPGF